MTVNSQIRNLVAAGERVSRNVLLQAAGGTLDRVFLKHRHGTNEDVDTLMEWLTIWNGPMSYPRVVEHGPLAVQSNSEGDHASGTGAQAVIISGCDKDGNLQMEILELNGLNPVPTALDYFWFEFAHVIRTGTLYGGAEGTITISHDPSAVLPGDGQVMGIIQPEFNRTQNCVFVIPNEYSGYVLGASAGTSTENRGAKFGIRVSARNGVRQIMSTSFISAGGPNDMPAPAPERIHYPSLVEMVGLANLINTEWFGGVTMLLVHDDYDLSIPEELLLQPPGVIAQWLTDHPQVDVTLAGVSQGPWV